MTLTVLCVLNGTKYDASYVAKLRAMVGRHLKVTHRFLCISDRTLGIPGVEELVTELKGYSTAWWAKMMLFAPEVRGDGPAIYFDLDTVICGDLSPLAFIAGNYKFAICENFTKRAGHPTWPCAYGSAVMTFGRGWGQDVFDAWYARHMEWMADAGQYGDQMVIEKLAPGMPLLQSLTPRGYFLGYRELADHRHNRPPGASVVVFAGRNKPHNTDVEWVRREWTI